MQAERTRGEELIPGIPNQTVAELDDLIVQFGGERPAGRSFRLVDNGKKKTFISEDTERLRAYTEQHLHGTLDPETMMVSFHGLFFIDTAKRVFPHLGYDMEDIDLK